MYVYLPGNLSTGDQLQGHIHEFFKITNSIIHCDDNVNKAELLTFMGVKNDDSDNSAVENVSTCFYL
ncbi:hypothetical protein EB796_020226 [Bugula neritina]|uniref:Uncharacterized protein n=1 Tax=Bugula neritina TaxID=10212 RepID=A0A7J7J5M4_BUGNE|nr:hypothetical protein EB796_020226 [Bugula neritina]